jgi:hypothetical protein
VVARATRLKERGPQQNVRKEVLLLYVLEISYFGKTKKLKVYGRGPVVRTNRSGTRSRRVPLFKPINELIERIHREERVRFSPDAPADEVVLRTALTAVMSYPVLREIRESHWGVLAIECLRNVLLLLHTLNEKCWRNGQ